MKSTTKPYDYAVFIGRMQPPHRAHIEIIKRTLATEAENVIILLGSANQVRTIKNPWTSEERKQMVLDSLTAEEQARMIVLPIQDTVYNDQLWVKQIQDAVDQVTSSDSKIAITGHAKDTSSYYLALFPQWSLLDIENIDDIHASAIRTCYFNIPTQSGEFDETVFDCKIGDQLPIGIGDYLKAFALTDDYDRLAGEQLFVDQYKQSWAAAPYEPIFVTVDAVVVQSGHVLLVQRKANPGKGTYAIPGGFLNPDEKIVDGMLRELREETKLKVPEPVLQGSIKAQEVYDHPGRSLRGRTITHAYLIVLKSGPLPKVRGGDDAARAQWVPLSTFFKMGNQMFEDHWHIVNDLVNRM